MTSQEINPVGHRLCARAVYLGVTADIFKKPVREQEVRSVNSERTRMFPHSALNEPLECAQPRRWLKGRTADIIDVSGCGQPTGDGIGHQGGGVHVR